MKKLITILASYGICIGAAAILAGCCLLLSGCGTPGKHGEIMSVSTWLCGAKVTATTSTTGTPELWLGVGRQTVFYAPTSTNGPIYAPRVGTAFTSKQNAYNPTSADAAETIFTGDVMISTNATGGAVVPKLGPPKFQ